MLNVNSFNNEQFENGSPIIMVTLSDLESVVRGILKEFNEAEKAQKDATLLTVKQTAASLNVDRSTLWSWEKKGYLKPVRIGRKVRYPKHMIDGLKRGGEE